MQLSTLTFTETAQNTVLTGDLGTGSRDYAAQQRVRFYSTVDVVILDVQGYLPFSQAGGTKNSGRAVRNLLDLCVVAQSKCNVWARVNDE